ncbi:hypothetical protein BJX61DRAFT_540778 [Aspergillus egyptiacus]|nr:hypothetical protein BJX61DRAFT_540778 [Aspergillus egyptiacus]
MAVLSKDTMTEASVDHRERSQSPASKHAHFSKLRKHLAAIKQEWAPLLPAKTQWDDEYNFNPGPWAGKGLDPNFHGHH